MIFFNDFIENIPRKNKQNISTQNLFRGVSHSNADIAYDHDAASNSHSKRMQLAIWTRRDTS